MMAFSALAPRAGTIAENVLEGSVQGGLIVRLSSHVGKIIVIIIRAFPLGDTKVALD